MIKLCIYNEYGFNMASLRFKASKNFDKYMQELLTQGVSNGLPVERLTEEEWGQLNEEIKSFGVKLVKRQHRNGGMYYAFTKYEPELSDERTVVDKARTFHQGTENAFNYLLGEIRNRYPNISDEAIINMIKDGGKDTELIYEQLRYKQNGRYTGTTPEDLEDAFVFALQSSGNKNELISMAGIHNWNPEKYRNTSVLNMSIHKDNPYGRNIRMEGNQDWTWFRKCAGNKLPPARDYKNPDGFHISLNVNVNRKILSILDDILIEDGGQYIHSYKFPKTNFYDDVATRHDPITVYLHSRNKELERKIAQAVQPFVRSNEGLIGEMLAGGVSICPDTSSTGISVGKQAAQEIAELISAYKDRL